MKVYANCKKMPNLNISMGNALSLYLKDEVNVWLKKYEWFSIWYFCNPTLNINVILLNINVNVVANINVKIELKIK